MRSLTRTVRLSVLAGPLLSAGCASSPRTAAPLPETRAMTAAAVPNGFHRATGTFELTMNPQPPYESSDGIALTRIAISKVFHGALEATSTMEMIAAGTAVKGSAGYVAIERVTGTLDGRTGTFVLQHSGTMTRGAPELSVTIVPDSGTGELTGISGKLTIDIVDKKHYFTMDYRIGS